MYVSGVKMDVYTSFHYFMNSFALNLFVSLNIAHPEYQIVLLFNITLFFLVLLDMSRERSRLWRKVIGGDKRATALEISDSFGLGGYTIFSHQGRRYTLKKHHLVIVHNKNILKGSR